MLIGCVDVLTALYGRVIAPKAVIAELTHPAAPMFVREWALDPPDWLDVVSARRPLVLPHLDPGETEAISVALDLGADLLLIDDLAGRQEATRRGLRIAGTLAVLDEADESGLLVFDDAVAELRRTGFRVSETVISAIREQRQR